MTNTLIKAAETICEERNHPDWPCVRRHTHGDFDDACAKAAANAILNGEEVTFLVNALRNSQKAIEEFREQGSPTAYWDDIENANLDALAAINKLKAEIKS